MFIAAYCIPCPLIAGGLSQVRVACSLVWASVTLMSENNDVCSQLEPAICFPGARREAAADASKD